MEIYKPITKRRLKEAVDLWCDVNSRNITEANLGHISTWDTSLIDDMSYLFILKIDFNDDISNWDTSNVLNMKFMFSYCENFDQELYWDTSKVKNMEKMFFHCKNFNKELCWNTSNVRKMNNIFDGCINLDQIFNWDISNVQLKNKVLKYNIIFDIENYNPFPRENPILK